MDYNCPVGNDDFIDSDKFDEINNLEGQLSALLAHERAQYGHVINNAYLYTMANVQFGFSRAMAKIRELRNMQFRDCPDMETEIRTKAKDFFEDLLSRSQKDSCIYSEDNRLGSELSDGFDFSLKSQKKIFSDLQSPVRKVPRDTESDVVNDTAFHRPKKRPMNMQFGKTPEVNRCDMILDQISRSSIAINSPVRKKRLSTEENNSNAVYSPKTEGIYCTENNSKRAIITSGVMRQKERALIHKSVHNPKMNCSEIVNIGEENVNNDTKRVRTADHVIEQMLTAGIKNKVEWMQNRIETKKELQENKFKIQHIVKIQKKKRETNGIGVVQKGDDTKKNQVSIFNCDVNARFGKMIVAWSKNSTSYRIGRLGCILGVNVAPDVKTTCQPFAISNSSKSTFSSQQISQLFTSSVFPKSVISELQNSPAADQVRLDTIHMAPKHIVNSSKQIGRAPLLDVTNVPVPELFKSPVLGARGLASVGAPKKHLRRQLETSGILHQRHNLVNANLSKQTGRASLFTVTTAFGPESYTSPEAGQKRTPPLGAPKKRLRTQKENSVMPHHHSLVRKNLFEVFSSRPFASYDSPPTSPMDFQPLQMMPWNDL